MHRLPGRPPRFHCDAVLSPGASVELPERVARHVAALRLHQGDAIVLFNGDGAESSATLAELRKSRVVAAVRERRIVDRESPLAVHLAQGVCAGDRMDFVLQKATELGVAAIQPVITARSIVRLSSDRQEKRETHWQNVAIAACEQCGRNRIPPVTASVRFDEFLARPSAAGSRILLASDGTGAVRTLATEAPVTILIGPEGGLSPEERDLAASRGYAAVRFGPRTLRSETAPLAVLAALQALYGDC